MAIILALTASWFVVRNAVIRLYAGSQPSFSLLFAPASGGAEDQIAFDRVVNNNGAADAISRALYLDAARREPLLPEPYLLAGLDASARGDFTRARHLMEEVRRRDPRQTVARFWLLDEYLRSGEYGKALEEVTPVLALQTQPGAREAIIALVTALVDVPEARPALVRKLRATPGWRDTFFTQAIASPSLAGAVPELLAAAPYRLGVPASPNEQRLVTDRVLRQRGVIAGFSQWRRLLPTAYAGRARQDTVYDGNFAGWPGSAPFAWRLHDARRPAVRRVQSSDLPEGTALEVSYRSDNRLTLAEQLIPVSPGAKRFTAKLRSIAGEEASPGALGVTIRCIDPERRLAEAALPLARSATEQHVDFNVPTSCPAIRLTLRSEPSIVVDTVDAQITGVRIAPRQN